MMEYRSSNYVVELGLLGLLALLWGSSYPLIRIALETIPPVTLMAGRVVVAMIVLLVVLRLRRLTLPCGPDDWLRLLPLAICNSIGAWTLLAWGQQFVDSGLASVLNSTSPIFVFLITILFTRHEVIGVRRIAGALIGMAGVVLIVGTDVLAGLGREVVAQLAILAGAVLYACAAIYGKRFSRLPSTVTAAATMVWAALVLVPAAVLMEDPWATRPSMPSLAAALVLAVACTGIALLIYFRLLRTLGSLNVASQAYLRAGIGVALGVVFLGETLTAAVATGLFAAIFGVALINSTRLPAILRRRST